MEYPNFSKPAYVASGVLTSQAYISVFTNTVYINKRGGNTMEFDVEKIKAYYEALISKRDEAVTIALANKDAKIAQALEEARQEIEAEVIAKITAEAEEPYMHDIKLYEQFVKPAEVVAEEVAPEVVADENIVIVEGE